MTGDAEARQLRLVEHVRRACAEAVAAGFQDAAMSGLCHEGAVEAAVGAVQSLKAEALLAAAEAAID
jgi:hypothetical protein